MDEMDTNELALTKKQLKALPLLLSTGRIEDAVKAAGISKTAFYEWMKQPVFRSAFEAQRMDIVNEGLHQLKMASGEASEVLRGLLKSERESIQLKAATEILSHISKFMEIEDIQQRLTDLETIVKGGSE
jgi:ACT domain-containing protein